MAQETGKIYITISDQRLGDGKGGGKDDPDKVINPFDDNETDALSKYAQHRFFSFIKSQASQMVNYTIGNIGNFTGDYQVQREVQVIQKMAGFGINLGLSFKAGVSLAGSTAGGLIGVSLAIATEAINYGLQEMTGRLSNRNQNYEIEQLREISGLNALTNGGR